MKTIASFTVNHDKLNKGMYVSRIDGDVVTFEDALYSMMLPSSNTLAESVATGAGEFLLKDFEKGTER